MERVGCTPSGHPDVPDGVQDGEFVRHEMLEVLLFKDKEVVVPLGLEQQSRALGPLVELLVDLGQHGAALGIGAGFHQLVVVVHLDDGDDGTGLLVILAQGVGLRGVHPVGGGQQVLLGPLALGPHQAAVHPEAAAVHLHPVGALLLSLQQPLGGKVRHGVLHLHLKEMVPHAGQLLEILVAPDHLAGVRAKHQDGQRRVDEGGFAGGVHADGHLVDILQDPLAALLAVFGVDHIQCGSDGGLHRRQHRLEGNGSQRHQEKEKKIQS
jgi:hypothetical protein